jgi:hypothetical protein
MYAPTLPADSLMFKFGQLGQILVQMIHIAVALLLYKLFEKTDKTQGLLVVIFSLLAVPLALMGILFTDVIHLAELFWGLWLIPLGMLVIKSKMFPIWTGYALYVGAIGYVAGTVSFFMIGSIPVFANVLTMGEVIWILWLIIKGSKDGKTSNT